MHSWPAFTAINEVRFGDADCVVVDLGLPPDPTHGPDAREQSQAHIVLESDEHEMLLDLETETSSGLEEKSLNQNDRVIAVDFDDVLAQSCAALTKAHNEYYGTKLTLDDFESYYPHRNRGWGSVEETNQKLNWFHKELNVLQWANPVPSVRAALTEIKKMGHPLHIVTARSEAEKPFVLDWLERHDLANLWDGVHFIGAFQFVAEAIKGDDLSGPAISSTGSGAEPAAGNAADMEKRLKEAFLKNADNNSKVAVLRKIGASLPIDDHVLNVDKAAEAGIQCLLFGDNYRWNRRRWGMQTPEDAMHFEERRQAGLVIPKAELELLAGVERAANWDAIVDWVKKWDENAVDSTEDESETRCMRLP